MALTGEDIYKVDMLKRLYQKERTYQRMAFGEYSNDPSLSFSSFILFLERYLQKTKKEYAGKWEKDLPPWLINCSEYEKNGYAPVKAYEELVKVFALAGAALETYSRIDPNKWRENASLDAMKWIQK
jgi:hypothetical protein